MRIRTLWLVGLMCPLLGIAMSAGLDSMARLATAEVAQRPVPERGLADGRPPVSRDRAHEGTLHLNFRNVDILQMVTLMSELTGKNFLVDDRVRGKVTLIAPQPVTRAEAYQIFLAALAMQGFTVISQGPISTIVPLRDAQGHPLPTQTDRARPHP